MTTTQSAPCSRCSGEGYLARYAHVANGRCFKCGRVAGLPAALPLATAATYEHSLRGLVIGAQQAHADRALDWWETAGEDEGYGTAMRVAGYLRRASEPARAEIIAALKALPLTPAWWDRARTAWRTAA